ncbi:MAG: cupin domain-containing protein [Sphaerochaeta sp.]|nr:cupin domain-containing protein [Sphaerochaeta sp.]
MDGVGEVTIDEKKFTVRSGESILLPGNVPHAVYAPERFKMFLVVSF